MTRSFSLILLFLLVTLINLLVSEARPLIILKIHGPNDTRSFDWLTLNGIKDGPSPGVCHKSTDTQNFGGIKDPGPSPGEGHKLVTKNHQ